MNFLVLEKEFQIQSSEETSSLQFQYSGAIAREMIEAHQLKLDLHIAALLYGEGRGQAQIVELERNHLKISYFQLSHFPEKTKLDVIIGLCRPQLVKRVIQSSMVLGIRNIFFVASSRGEASYLQSKIWQERSLRHEIMLGMSQSGDPLPVQLQVFKNFRDFISELKNQEGFGDARKLLASTQNQVLLDTKAQLSNQTFLAIGSEKGWSESEEKSFFDLGFNPVNFGPRIFRVDQALIYAAGLSVISSDQNQRL